MHWRGSFLLLGACAGESDVAGGARRLPAPAVLDEETIGLANIDDDDLNGAPDWDDAGATLGIDDDLVDLPLPIEEGAVSLHLVTDSETIRVWVDGSVALDSDHPVATVHPVEGAARVEFGGFLDEGDLEIRSAGGSSSTTLRSAPLVLNHHLQQGELEAVLESDGARGNEAFVDGFRDVLSDRLLTADIAEYGWDVWVQDEFEFASLTAPDRRMDVIIDSIRSKNGRGLDDFPEGELQEPGVAVRTWGDGRATSQDSFGNLEVSPPVTVGGVEYPYGRIYYGRGYDGALTADLAGFLADQRVQAPFEVDASFMCVGHVDETMAFLPDPSAPKGFRLYMADVGLAYAFLEGLDPEMEIPKYRRSHGYGTVGEVLDDANLRAYNEEVQADGIDPVREVMKAELGLDEEDIVDIPALFESVGWCAGTAVSLIPGTINLTVFTDETGQTHLFVADPFFRGSDESQQNDPLIAEIEALLPEEAEVHWLDDWDWYHMGMGEVHCGSNTRRAPVATWWEDARHLWGGEG